VFASMHMTAFPLEAEGGGIPKREPPRPQGDPSLFSDFGKVGSGPASLVRDLLLLGSINAGIRL
jgi:hypothetical protein